MHRRGFTLIELLVVIPLVPRRKPARRGFTLIELLVVIAIVAVLAVVVVLVLNPAQLIQQSRDSNRISDMASLSSALSLYLTDAGTNGTVSLGSANTVYVSVPDPSATSTAGDQCQGLGLPTLPAIYSYHCAASSTFRLANANGWIPVNFAGMSNGSPLGQLPMDPTNSTGSRLYYTYTTNGSQYEVTAVPESSKYRLGGSGDVISPDGGTLASVFEKGSRLGLEPLDYGDSSLVGYWTFEEGSSSIAYDYSGSNATGSWSGTPTGTAGYYSAGKIGNWAGAFNGLLTSSSSYVAVSTSPSLGASLSICAWQKLSSFIGWSGDGISLVAKTVGSFSSPYTDYSLGVNVSGTTSFVVGNGVARTILNGSSSVSANTWGYVCGTYNGNTLNAYVNGIADANSAIGSYASIGSNSSPLLIGGDYILSPYYDTPAGLVDDVRIYNRALSSAEISALYNGGK